MGWDFTEGFSKKDMIDDIKRTIGANLIASKVVGREFWLVEKAGESSQIVLFLLAKNGQDWGYKDMTESMGPYYYKCPIAFLDLAPERNAEWRRQIRAKHV
jgi:hypothetical protein